MKRCFFLLLTVSLAVLVTEVHGQVVVPASDARSSAVYGHGTGKVIVQPTHVRVSVPIRVSEDVAYDAIQRLGEVRQEVVDRAIELGAIEGQLKSVGFQCSNSLNDGSISIGRPGATNSQHMAWCYVIADFKLPEGTNAAAALLVANDKIGDLVSVLPEQTNSRRSMSYSTLAIGINTRQLEFPLAAFWAEVSREDRLKAYRDALAEANEEVDLALEVLEIDGQVSRTIAKDSVSYVRPTQHPAAEALMSSSAPGFALSPFPDAVSHSISLRVTAAYKADNQ